MWLLCRWEGEMQRLGDEEVRPFDTEVLRASEI